MNEYIAVIRYECPERMHAIAATIETHLSIVRGVVRVSCDVPSSAALVWYNRGTASLAELVRELEGMGVRVVGVAQSKSDVGVQPSAISA